MESGTQKLVVLPDFEVAQAKQKPVTDISLRGLGALQDTHAVTIRQSSFWNILLGSSATC